MDRESRESARFVPPPTLTAWREKVLIRKFATHFLAHKVFIPRTPYLESFVVTAHPQFTDNTGAGRFGLVLYSYFFSNSIQFRITVIGSDAASGRTEVMRNFWPSGIAAQRWASAKPLPMMGTVNKATGAPVR